LCATRPPLSSFRPLDLIIFETGIAVFFRGCARHHRGGDLSAGKKTCRVRTMLDSAGSASLPTRSCGASRPLPSTALQDAESWPLVIAIPTSADSRIAPRVFHLQLLTLSILSLIVAAPATCAFSASRFLEVVGNHARSFAILSSTFKAAAFEASSFSFCTASSSIFSWSVPLLRFCQSTRASSDFSILIRTAGKRAGPANRFR